MPLELDKVQEYQRIPGSQEQRLVRVQPYVRITHGGDPPIFIQGGQFYYQGGTPVTELPEWLTEEVARLSPTVRAEIGLKDDEPDAEPQPKPKPPKVEVETWTCSDPDCAKSMPKRGRNFHMLYHEKQKKKHVAELIRLGREQGRISD